MEWGETPKTLITSGVSVLGFFWILFPEYPLWGLAVFDKMFELL